MTLTLAQRRRLIEIMCRYVLSLYDKPYKVRTLRNYNPDFTSNWVAELWNHDGTALLGPDHASFGADTPFDAVYGLVALVESRKGIRNRS